MLVQVGLELKDPPTSQSAGIKGASPLPSRVLTTVTLAGLKLTAILLLEILIYHTWHENSFLTNEGFTRV